MTLTLTEIRKVIVALAGVIAQGIAVGVVHGTALHYANVALAVLTAVGVYLVPNTHPALSPLKQAVLDATNESPPK